MRGQNTLGACAEVCDRDGYEYFSYGIPGSGFREFRACGYRGKTITDESRFCLCQCYPQPCQKMEAQGYNLYQFTGGKNDF